MKFDDPRITYTITVTEDHAAVRGNAMASGDDAADKAQEDEIIRRLNSGDVWAWATVKVTATYEEFSGEAHLGCCSYASEADFKADAYYRDMRFEAFEDLKRNLGGAISNGVDASRVLREIQS